MDYTPLFSSGYKQIKGAMAEEEMYEAPPTLSKMISSDGVPAATSEFAAATPGIQSSAASTSDVHADPLSAVEELKANVEQVKASKSVPEILDILCDVDVDVDPLSGLEQLKASKSVPEILDILGISATTRGADKLTDAGLLVQLSNWKKGIPIDSDYFSKYVDHSSGKARQYRYMERMKQDKERLFKRRDYEREKKLDKKFEMLIEEQSQMELQALTQRPCTSQSTDAVAVSAATKKRKANEEQSPMELQEDWSEPAEQCTSRTTDADCTALTVSTDWWEPEQQSTSHATDAECKPPTKKRAKLMLKKTASFLYQQQQGQEMQATTSTNVTISPKRPVRSCTVVKTPTKEQYDDMTSAWDDINRKITLKALFEKNQRKTSHEASVPENLHVMIEKACAREVESRDVVATDVCTTAAVCPFDALEQPQQVIAWQQQQITKLTEQRDKYLSCVDTLIDFIDNPNVETPELNVDSTALTAQQMFGDDADTDTDNESYEADVSSDEDRQPSPTPLFSVESQSESQLNVSSEEDTQESSATQLRKAVKDIESELADLEKSGVDETAAVVEEAAAVVEEAAAVVEEAAPVVEEAAAEVEKLDAKKTGGSEDISHLPMRPSRRLSDSDMSDYYLSTGSSDDVGYDEKKFVDDRSDVETEEEKRAWREVNVSDVRAMGRHAATSGNQLNNRTAQKHDAEVVTAVHKVSALLSMSASKTCFDD